MRGVFHLTKNSGLNFQNFGMSNGTVFFYQASQPNQSHSIPAWAHFPPRITWQNAEGLWWSGCVKCRKLLHVEKFNTHSEFNSFLIFTWLTQSCVMRKTNELYFRESMQTGRTDPQEIQNDQSTIFQEIRSFFVENRLSRTGSNCGRSFCIQCSASSKDSPPSCSFLWLELGLIHIQ